MYNMYERYWQLNEQPFRNTAHPRYLYYSKKHDEALVRLLYAVSESKGLMVLTGEIGTGKTYVCKMFMKELLEKGYRVAMPATPDLNPTEFLQQILCELQMEYRGKSQVEAWQDLMPGERRPNFKRAAREIVRRALGHKVRRNERWR